MKHNKLILSGFLLFLIPLACTIPTFGMKTAPTVEPTMLATALPAQADAQEMFSTDPNTGAQVITVTEQMLGNMLNRQMSESPSAMLSEPIVTLRDGRINITGKADQAGITLDTTIVILPSVTPEGAPAIAIETVKIGPLEAPEAVRTAVSELAINMFTNALGNGVANQKIESITISDGVMVVVMQPNQ